MIYSSVQQYSIDPMVSYELDEHERYIPLDESVIHGNGGYGARWIVDSDNEMYYLDFPDPHEPFIVYKTIRVVANISVAIQNGGVIASDNLAEAKLVVKDSACNKEFPAVLQSPLAGNEEITVALSSDVIYNIFIDRILTVTPPARIHFTAHKKLAGGIVFVLGVSTYCAVYSLDNVVN